MHFTLNSSAMYICTKQQFMQILKQWFSFFRFRRQVCRSPPQPEADLLNVILEISGESISSECYLGLFWGDHFEEPKSGTSPRTNFQPHYHTQAPFLVIKS